MPYDLIYKCNLINKTKNEENRTRDIEIKNRLTVTRGKVKGITGRKKERSLKNMYKGHIDKAKGG